MPSVAPSARVKLVKEFDCAYNFAGGAVTLHARWGKQNVHGAGASRDHVQDVANRGAVWRSDHPHARSEEHTSELQSQSNLVCRLLLEKKKKKKEGTDN